MVKKNLTLLNDEFEEYEATVKIPSNIPGSVKNRVMDKVRLVKNADIDEGMSDEEVLQNVDNVGELMGEVQEILIDFAVKHGKVVEPEGKEFSKDSLSVPAYDKVLQQYTESIEGVDVSGN